MSQLTEDRRRSVPQAVDTVRPARTAEPGPSTVPFRHGFPRWTSAAIFAAAALVVGGASAITEFSVPIFVVGTLCLGALAVTAITWVAEGRRRAADRAVTFGVTGAFLLALVPLVSVLSTVVQNGIKRFDAEFFTYSQAGIVGAGGGAFHAIVGTLVTSGLAAAISVPIGIGAAIYLVEYANGRLKTVLTFLVDVMIGIPSIVAGLFAYALFVVIFGPGTTLGVMGSIALSVLMIPIVVRSTEEMLRAVPSGLREAALALGVPKWRTIVSVVLPSAAAGIASGVTLAVARIVGETAPLLVTVGIVSGTNWNPFSGQMTTLSVLAYTTYQNPGVPQQPSFDLAWSAALLLVIIVLVLNLAGRLIARLFAPKTTS